jgi:hypothetical protein
VYEAKKSSIVLVEMVEAPSTNSSSSNVVGVVATNLGLNISGDLGLDVSGDLGLDVSGSAAALLIS